MNEGWAVLIHEKIMLDLELPDKYQLAFFKSHNQVVRPIVGRINPYHLGYNSYLRRLSVNMGSKNVKLQEKFTMMNLLFELI